MKTRNRVQSGFTLPELMVVVLIAIGAAAFAVPTYMNSVHMAKLRGAGTDFSGILQSARIRAVQDNRFYSVYILTGSAQEAFADIYPQSATGVSGYGGTQIDPNDPAVVLASEITPISVGSAPNTSGLKGLFLPSGSLLPVNDASSSSTPVTFGPRGLPCTTQSATGGTVCDSAGGATAFWIFFQSTSTKAWEAVTVSPAGRIQKWQYGTSTWSKVE